jgi:uncharacterized protein with PQ loop repeat
MLSETESQDVCVRQGCFYQMANSLKEQQSKLILLFSLILHYITSQTFFLYTYISITHLYFNLYRPSLHHYTSYINIRCIPTAVPHASANLSLCDFLARSKGHQTTSSRTRAQIFISTGFWSLTSAKDQEKKRILMSLLPPTTVLKNCLL